MKSVRALSEISAPRNAKWWSDWISASSTRNYMINDPLNDWLHAMSRRNLSPLSSSRVSNLDPESFTEFIMNRGNDFEELVVNKLRRKLGAEHVVTLSNGYEARKASGCQKTLDAMMNGIPVIHSAVVHNPENKTYGLIDLLVRSDWMSKIFIDAPYIEPQSATRLRLKSNKHKAPKYHYVLIDVKFSTIHISADGTHILNSGSIPAYKSQLYIYLEAISRIQGCNPGKAYILGRRYKSKSKSFPWTKNRPLAMLGTIDYLVRDEKYVEATRNALEWLRQCRSQDAVDWNVTSPPLSRPELYPNMCNTMDYPHHRMKKQLASQYDELTQLWKVGTRNRELAHAQQVYSWTDERCTPAVLGIDSPFTTRILDNILEVNQSHTDTYRSGQTVIPRMIKSNLGDWKHPKPIEFYVDFETINAVMFDFDSPLYDSGDSFIFMIGVGYTDPDGVWIYRNFTVDAITREEEEQICGEFSFFIKDMADKYNITQPNCYHWAHAEKTFWRDAMKRHRQAARHWYTDWNWVDMLALFKEEPITIRGALDFGLKNVVRALYDLNCIQVTWPESDCKSGLDAMLSAVRAYKRSLKEDIPFHSISVVNDIIVYNEYDVKVLFAIMEYLREHHIHPKVKTRVPFGPTPCTLRQLPHRIDLWKFKVAQRTRSRWESLGRELIPIKL